MTGPLGQCATFCVYPEPGSRLHFRVRIFRSERTLRGYLRNDVMPRRLGRYGRAMCTTWWKVKCAKGQRDRVTPDLGEILLTTRNLGTEVIAHECTHAAIGWAHRQRIAAFGEKVERGHVKQASPDEERFCYGLGQMARQIAGQCWRRKLIT